LQEIHALTISKLGSLRPPYAPVSRVIHAVRWNVSSSACGRVSY
jgi:hypothetical protein